MLGLLDRRLIKPALLPALAATALTVLRALPPRKGSATLQKAATSQPRSLDTSVAA